jgi:hypothetical protein
LEVIGAIPAQIHGTGDQLRVCVVPTDSGWRSSLQVAGSAVFVVALCIVAECTDIIICITCFAADFGACFQFFARGSGRAEIAGHGVVAVVDASRFEVIVDTILTGLADVEVVRAGAAELVDSTDVENPVRLRLDSEACRDCGLEVARGVEGFAVEGRFALVAGGVQSGAVLTVLDLTSQEVLAGGVRSVANRSGSQRDATGASRKHEIPGIAPGADA